MDSCGYFPLGWVWNVLAFLKSCINQLQQFKFIYERENSYVMRLDIKLYHMNFPVNSKIILPNVSESISFDWPCQYKCITSYITLCHRYERKKQEKRMRQQFDNLCVLFCHSCSFSTAKIVDISINFAKLMRRL